MFHVIIDIKLQGGIIMERHKLKLITALTIFGSIGLFKRMIPYSSSLVALGRGVIGALFLGLVMVARKKSIPMKQVKSQLGILLLSGFLIGGNWILLFEAYNHTSVSVATVSYYMAPVFVILMSPILFNEKLTPVKMLSSAAAFLGMVLVSGVFNAENVGTLGVLFGLGAAVMYAGVILLNKMIKDISGTDQTFIQLFFASITLLPYVLITEDLSSLHFDSRGLVLLLIVGVFHTGFAYVLYFGAIPHLPAQTVGIMSYIDPIVAVILSQLILQEELTLPGLIGVILVLGSTLVVELNQYRSKKAIEDY